MKKVLFVTSEAVPFIKTGGLADVTGSLPKYFDKKKYDVRIMIPKYLCIEEKLTADLENLGNFSISLGWREQYVGVFHKVVEGVTYYFIDNEYYFGGDQPYNRIYEDVEKFAFFSKAAIAAMKFIDFQADIIHCHDWQTGMVPVFLKYFYGEDPFYQKMKSVFTIHNLKFQGRWKLNEVKDITGLPAKFFMPDQLESYGEANYLKGGIVYSDMVTTVSKSYAQEITTPEGGEGLDGLLRAKSDHLYGIVNGIDYDEYDPVTDQRIGTHFDKMNVVKMKPANKAGLQEELGLPKEEDASLIGIVSRMTVQKGMDLIAYVMDELLGDKKIQFAVLGTGEERFENMFRHFAWKYERQMGVCLQYSEDLAHRIYAGADAFLMPSMFEPCGLSQLMSMRYGTVPMVRETGGLRDTVCPYNEYEQTGNGFSFANYNAHEMLHMIRYAKDTYVNHRNEWNGIVKRAMECDFSWNASARDYETLYEELLKMQ